MHKSDYITLQQKIETTRQELYEMYKENNLTDKNVVELSQTLDELLNEIKHKKR
ncbi:aspartyl-phosphate phosphatase Spo0E family protein [Filobacillus milosensis]|uniref:Aspartyl-phosphate phosphatase Spo0E family protein n=1 Tax=Filobacillus milosensis TaxID=94137 RepID=A0A4Y8IHP5_9BACI|nr:aspartyl-phosphate phosphatase Spo0E family protein [Filobacillus milosensis]TFB14213.1 aspartyl-phosphate phosphatase Spo0E family protein [Filobacillus milosensis]